MSQWFTNLAVLVGAVLVLIGFWMMYQPLAWITLGGLIIWFAFMLSGPDETLDKSS